MFNVILTIVGVGLTILARILAPKRPTPRPDIADIGPPKVQQGVPVPVPYGTCLVAPNAFWWGNVRSIAEVGAPGVINYGFDHAAAICMGPVDILDVTYGGKSLVQYSVKRTYIDPNTGKLKSDGHPIVTFHDPTQPPPGTVGANSIANPFPLLASAASSTTPLAVMADAQSLFGGETSGGGLSNSYMAFFMGTTTQGPSTQYGSCVAQSQNGPGATAVPTPAYKNLCYAVVYGYPGSTNTGYYGTSPTPQPMRVVVRRLPNTLSTLIGTDYSNMGGSANPIEALYDIATSASFSDFQANLQINPALMDVAAWKAACQQIYTEAFNGTDPGAAIPKTSSANVGNGVFSQISGGIGAPVETITVTMTSSGGSGATFSVTGTVSMSIGTGTVGTAFTSSVISFLLSAGSTNFASGDSWTFVTAVISSAGVDFVVGESDAEVAENHFRQLQILIDGVCFTDQETGLFTIQLCRGGYTVADLPVVSESNYGASLQYSESSWADTYNEASVRYRARGPNNAQPVTAAGNAWTMQQGVATVQNIAALQANGGIPQVAEPIDCSELSNGLSAGVVAQRSLKVISQVRGSAQWDQDRSAHAYKPGDVIVLKSSRFGITSKVMRITTVKTGTLESGKMHLTATEDVYTTSIPGVPGSGSFSGSGSGSAPPVPIAPGTASLTASPATATVAVGGTDQITVTSSVAGDTFTYTLVDPSIGTVNSAGVFLGKAVGTTVVNINSAAGGSTSVTITVTAASTPAIITAQLSPASVTLAVGQTVTLQNDSLDGNGNPIADTWTLVSANSGIASVSGMAVTGVAAGGAIDVTGTDMNSNTFIVSVTVVPASGGGGGSPYAIQLASSATLSATLTAFSGALSAFSVALRMLVDPLLNASLSFPFILELSNGSTTAFGMTVETNSGSLIITTTTNGTTGNGPSVSILQTNLPVSGTWINVSLDYNGAGSGSAALNVTLDGGGAITGGSSSTAFGTGGIGSGNIAAGNDQFQFVVGTGPATLGGLVLQNQVNPAPYAPINPAVAGGEIQQAYTFDGSSLVEVNGGTTLTPSGTTAYVTEGGTYPWGTSGLAITPSAITVRQGTMVTVAISGATGAVTPASSSSATASATVSGSTATIVASNDGTATITFTDSLGNTGTVAVTVSSAASAPTTLSLTPSEATAVDGGPDVQFQATVDDQYGDTSAVSVGLNSSNPSVATVPSTVPSGETFDAAIQGPGSTTITASYTGLTSKTAILAVRSPIITGAQVFGVKINSGFYGTGGLATTLVGLATDLNCVCAVDICKWAALNPSSGVYDWTNTDLAFAAYEAAGISRVVWTFETVPSWTAGYGGTEYSYPTDPTNFTTLCGQAASFLTAFCNRYAGRIYAIEILNEPNQPFNWVPTPNVGFYTQINNACFSAIKAADSSILVLSCSATGLEDGPSNAYTGVSFISDFVNGGGQYDWISIHPYPGGSGNPATDNYPSDNSWDDIGRVKSILPAGTQIAITEIGYNSASSSTIAGYLSYIGNSVATTYADVVPFCAVFCISDYVDANFGLYDSDNATIKLQGTAWQSFCESVGQ